MPTAKTKPEWRAPDGIAAIFSCSAGVLDEDRTAVLLAGLPRAPARRMAERTDAAVRYPVLSLVSRPGRVVDAEVIAGPAANSAIEKARRTGIDRIAAGTPLGNSCWTLPSGPETQWGDCGGLADGPEEAIS